MSLNSLRPKAKYNCPQSELYAVCAIGWNSYMDYVSDFTNFKPMYTPAFGTAKMLQLDVTKKLPDYQGRNEPSELALVALKGKATDGLVNWLSLKSYIEESVAENEQKAKLEAAGIKYYNKASKFDWESVDSLMKEGSTYIANNTVALSNNNNMPAGFEVAFNDVKDEIKTLYNDFKTKEQVSIEKTDAKLEANNDVYDDLLKMFKDGRLIMRGNAATRRRFVFREVRKLVTPASKKIKTYKGIIVANGIINLGESPTGAVRIKITVLKGGPLEIGLSIDGATFNGNTVTLAGKGSETILIADLNSTGNLILLVNQNALVEGSYRVEVFK